MMNLDEVLKTLDGIAVAAQFFPPASAYAKLSETLLQIAIKTNAAHIALFGKPLDYSTIPEFKPVPLASGTAPQPRT